EGIFYDDITFVVEGKKFTFTDKHYDEISDQYFANEFNKLEEEEARLEAERNRVATYKCSICNNDFEHSGYKEISTGVWRKCKDPYQCFICSKTCGMKHTKKMVDLVGF
ncbi:MAG: hypothetical protein HOK72_09350, partial [Flavobacteriales bacterium]|nr:hypothetical protein [Flavobacteriales bacterium]